MLGASIAEVALNKTSQLAQVLHFIGDPIVALLIATIYSFFSLGYAKGFSKDKVLQFTNDCLYCKHIVSDWCRHAFNKVLLDSIGTTIADMAKESHISPILLGWGIAALIRIATGSATVSMMTATGIVAPIAQAHQV